MELKIQPVVRGAAEPERGLKGSSSSPIVSVHFR